MSTTIDTTKGELQTTAPLPSTLPAAESNEALGTPPEMALMQAMMLVEDAMAREREGRRATRELRRTARREALDARERMAGAQLVAGLASGLASATSALASSAKMNENSIGQRDWGLASGIAQAGNEVASAVAKGHSNDASAKADAASELDEMVGEGNEALIELRRQREKATEALAAIANARSQALLATTR